MYRFTLLALSAFISFALSAEDIRIGIYSHASIRQCSFVVVQGEYQISLADGKTISLPIHTQADIRQNGKKITLTVKGKTYSFQDKCKLRSIGDANFRMVSTHFKSHNRKFSGSLDVRIYGTMRLINEVDVEEYVCGVIEAEGGTGNPLEYNKVQAVISRTYALNNINRHSAEGFDLCDATHCQVYHGLVRFDPEIVEAVHETRDIVMVDHNIQLITAAFHSNCGGETRNAGDVWSKHVPYLIAVPDTFCTGMLQARWKKTISADKWDHYMKTHRIPSENMASCDGVFVVEDPQRYHFHDEQTLVPLRGIREHFELKSTRFEAERLGQEIKLMGRGYGHGVGLCQEGGIKRARSGECYEDILHHYYTNVHLITRNMLWFFRE
jgi:stage II sporulation protein D